ncbi:MAG: GDSL-type esterase/lipase family protein [Candidatus Puniceispirillum sp.]
MSIAQIITTAAASVGIELKLSKTSEAKLNDAGTMEYATDDMKLLTQNEIADSLCILTDGVARFSRTAGDRVAEFATVKAAFTPLGISGLNSPGRYMSDIALDAGSSYIRFSLKRWHDLVYADPALGARLMAFILARANGLLWSTRGIYKPKEDHDVSLHEGVKHESDRDTIYRLREGAFFSPLGLDNLTRLLAFAELRLYPKGEAIIPEGAISDGLYILFSGRVDASFESMVDGNRVRKSRTIVRPGVALSWSNGFTRMMAPYSVLPTRDTTMLKISDANMRALVDTEPMLAAALFQRQIWQVGRYQQSASGLTNFADNSEAGLLATLLAHNGSKIPVDSPLHGAVHALKNRFTRGYALDSIYNAVISGNEAERSVAGLVMDALEGIEREHRFFEQLNKVYTRVVSAPADANHATLRKLSQADFSLAFDQVPYVIQGMENLPDNPTNIFIYNHLAAVPENALANGHAFSIDSHFVSSKILFPHYGDGGQRIVRASRKAEFWRNGYYSRLDNIVVHTPESDRLVETQPEKEWRKEKLYVEAQKAFDANRPIAIAPEGTSETPDNFTPTSPGPLKAGAFLLAARLKPDPMIVPIALANFDCPVAETTYAAVIKPAFRIIDFVPDTNDFEALNAFLQDYRETFRGYVAEARALAEKAKVMSPDEQGAIVTNLGLVSPVEEEFEADIRELEMHRLEQQQSHKTIVLYGSSTFRLWKHAADDLSSSNLVNLGFGGATIEACRVFFNRTVQPHKPANLAIYVGDNDIGGGMTVDQVKHEFELFMAHVSEALPDTKCQLISVKPSPFRAHLEPYILELNAHIEALAASNPKWHYIDLHTPMLDADGQPSAVFYDSDPLHMNSVGYALLAQLLRNGINAQ